MKYYTGIGSRKTPPEILDIMQKIGFKLAKMGWTLRSGGTIGANTAFYMGARQACGQAGNKIEIYRPEHIEQFETGQQALEIAEKYHPYWNNLNYYVKKLHGRNTFQILGKNLNTPSKFVICWTPDGCKTHMMRSRTTGGTGTAISIANKRKIKIYNLANMDDYEEIVNSKKLKLF
jgi:hypothetical protein